MPAPLAGIVPILMNSARGLKILRDLGIAVTSIPAIEKTINAIPEEKQKQLVELIVQGPAYDFVNEQVFRNVKDTPSGTVIGPDADEIEKQKEQIQKDLKPPKAGEPPSIEPLITLPPEPMETKEEFPAEEDDKPLIETFPAGTEQGPVIFTMDDPRQIKTTGQYVGLPEGTDTKEKLQEIRDEAYKQFDSGKEGRYWYRDSAKTILDSVGGNIAEADKIAQLIGVFSAGSPVGTDLNYALQAYAAHKRGEDIFTGRFPTAQSQKAKTILEGGTWEGRKTNNFYKAIAREFNPELSNEPVVDIWMMRAFGFEDFDGTPTEAQYNTVSNEIKNILGKAREIDPSYDINQIQAAIWVGAKAKKVGSMDKALFNYQNAIENNLGQISWESAPGGSLNHLVGFGDLPYKDRQEYHVEASKIFLDDKGNDILAQAIGVLTPNEFEAPGHYMDEVNPGSQTEVIIPKGYKETKALDKNTVALIDAYAAAKGLILGQEAVPWHRPFYTDSANKADGVKITIDDGRIATQAETRQLSQEANKIASEIAGREINDFNLIGSEDGGRFLNVVFDDAGNKVFTNKQFTDIISKAADRVFPGEQKVDLNYFASDGNYISNDWNKNLNGEDYIKTIGQAGSDIQKRVLDLLPSLIEKKYQLDKGFGEKYKLELNTAINQKYRTSGGTRGGGTPGQVQEVDKSGVVPPAQLTTQNFLDPKLMDRLLKSQGGVEGFNEIFERAAPMPGSTKRKMNFELADILDDKYNLSGFPEGESEETVTPERLEYLQRTVSKRFEAIDYIVSAAYNVINGEDKNTIFVVDNDGLPVAAAKLEDRFRSDKAYTREAITITEAGSVFKNAGDQLFKDILQKAKDEGKKYIVAEDLTSTEALEAMKKRGFKTPTTKALKRFKGRKIRRPNGRVAYQKNLVYVIE